MAKSSEKAVTKAAATALALPADLIVPKGAGLEHADAESFAIPFLVILQKGTPQADEDNEAYLEGAKQGMFLDTVANVYYDGVAENLGIIPVFYRRAFIEWKPERGGFVQEHSVAEAADMTWNRDEDGRDILPNGNQIVDTRYHYVILIRGDGALQPMVITMTSTQVKKSKRLNSDLDLQIRSNGLAATFQTKYKIETVAESNEHGTWRGWNITRAGLVEDQDQLDAAVSFYKAIKSGEVKEATDSLTPTGAAASDAGATDPAF